MTAANNKAERLAQIEALLLANPHGLTQAELARRLGVNRSTIHRNLQSMTAPVYEEGGRLFIDREASLVNVRFSLHEAVSVHLAARLLANCSDRQNPHAASALRKLGLSLRTLAPTIAKFVQASANEMDNPTGRRSDPRYLQVMEKLTLAWAERRRVHIWYENHEQIKKYDFAPYYLEPYATGQTTYVIGTIAPQNLRRTFKVERIQRIELLRQEYQILEDLDPETLFMDAWGIWTSDRQPVKVVLKFGPRVASRVRETRWHRSEQVTVLPDGSLLWSAWVAEPREMMNWIRGWGAQVEVLEPEEVRSGMAQEARDMARLYEGDGRLSGEA